jgi:hypothetical protein
MTTLFDGAGGGFDPKSLPSHDICRVYAVALVGLSPRLRRGTVHAWPAAR